MVAGTGTAEVHRQEGAGLVGRPGKRLGGWPRMSQMEGGQSVAAAELEARAGKAEEPVVASGV